MSRPLETEVDIEHEKFTQDSKLEVLVDDPSIVIEVIYLIVPNLFNLRNGLKHDCPPLCLFSRTRLNVGNGGYDSWVFT